MFFQETEQVSPNIGNPCMRAKELWVTGGFIVSGAVGHTIRDSAEHLCSRCGMRGRHSSWNQCIETLRDRLADAELANSHLRGRLIARGLSAATSC